MKKWLITLKNRRPKKQRTEEESTSYLKEDFMSRGYHSDEQVKALVAEAAELGLMKLSKGFDGDTIN